MSRYCPNCNKPRLEELPIFCNDVCEDAYREWLIEDVDPRVSSAIFDDHFLSRIVIEQMEFVQWLKEKEIYNPMESADTMIKMNNVWKLMKEDKPFKVS